jgi:hypothetical protein
MSIDQTAEALLDRLAIRELVENWLIYRDNRDWENFYDVWHDDGGILTTWGGRASAREFAEAAEAGYQRGDRMLHASGGVAIQVEGPRAIAQSKMRIMQRGPVDGVMCDVTCIGRNYDFVEKRDGQWGLVLRQPIYEQDFIVPVDPSETVILDPEILARRPEGYARLAYLQEGLGYPIIPNMPTATGPELEALLALGRTWLAGGELTWDTPKAAVSA